LTNEEAITSFGEVLLGYDQAAAIQEARRGLSLDYTAASKACPFGVDLNRVVEALAREDFNAAATVVGSAHPWAGILARCCHRFCEQAMLGTYPAGVEPIKLRALERAAGDYGAHPAVRIDLPPAGGRVAILGAGSGGLATALGVLRAGHRVTLYDAEPVLGGMFVVGYPSFRMPRPLLRRELEIESPLLELRLGESLDRPAVQRLLDEHDAGWLGIRQYSALAVSVAGEEGGGVYDALDFLRDVSYGRPPFTGGEVAVLGAGYTAQDAARSARRLGSQVRVLYRRGAEEMPVSDYNRYRFIKMMEEEGCPYEFLTNPVRIVRDAGAVVGVECQRIRLGEPDESGRPRPEPTGEPSFVVPASAVIKAFGQRPDFSLLPDGVALDGRLVVNEDYRSTRKGLFVVGDVAGNIGNDGAFVGGLQAARHINDYLADPIRPWPAVDPELKIVPDRPGRGLE